MVNGLAPEPVFTLNPRADPNRKEIGGGWVFSLDASFGLLTTVSASALALCISGAPLTSGG